MVMDATGIVINDGSNDRDFRIESNGSANMLFVDGGNDEVVIQKASSGATATAGSVLIIEDDDNTELSLLGGSSSVLAINFGHSGDNDEGKITFNTTAGSEDLQLVSSKAITLDAAGDITLDADDGDIYFKDGGTAFGQFSNSSGDLFIQQPTSDKDIVLRGLDGASYISALTLDMSAAGAAAFNSYITSTAVYGKDDGNSGIQFDGSDVVTLHTGGNLAQQIDASGRVTMPLQPAFNAYVSTAVSNLSINTAHILVFDTERFDIGSNYNASTGYFTAPVTGKYLLSTTVRIDNIDNASAYAYVQINTSNSNYYVIYDHGGTDAAYFSYSLSVLADMDATDTAYVSFYQSGGSNTADFTAGGAQRFTGYLVA